MKLVVSKMIMITSFQRDVFPNFFFVFVAELDKPNKSE